MGELKHIVLLYFVGKRCCNNLHSPLGVSRKPTLTNNPEEGAQTDTSYHMRVQLSEHADESHRNHLNVTLIFAKSTEISLNIFSLK